MEYEILCPSHNKIEKITFPDSYSTIEFEGDILCGKDEQKQRLQIRIENKKVAKLLRMV